MGRKRNLIEAANVTISIMLSRTIAIGISVAALLSADTLVTRSGRRVEGTYLGGTARQIRIDTGERTETFDVTEVTEIRFGDTTPAPAAAAATPKTRERIPLTQPERSVAAANTAPATASGREIPSGTPLVVRMIDDVDSERDSVGQTFRASLDEPVMVNGETLVPRGADLVIKLVEDKQSGKLTGKTELTLDVQSLLVNGRTIDVATESVTQASESRTNQTAKVAGGTTALGAIIGAIAGGGKGAAIGAVSGAAAGGAVQVLTKGQRVRIPSETRLSFTLQQPVRL